MVSARILLDVCQDSASLFKGIQLESKHFAAIIEITQGFIRNYLAPSLINTNSTSHQVAELNVERIEVIHTSLEVD